MQLYDHNSETHFALHAIVMRAHAAMFARCELRLTHNCCKLNIQDCMVETKPSTVQLVWY